MRSVNRKDKFTSLAHYLTVEMLHRSYDRLKKDSAVGTDGVSKADYGKNLQVNLEDLYYRLKTMKYRATPVLRVYLEKEDGSKRPLGIPITEDKIVEGAMAEILSAIYEVDFHGFNYGFRPGRSAHDALQSLQTALQKGKVNWVLDADKTKFFDSIDHKELMKVIKRRVVDSRLLRIIGKWLSSGYVEENKRGGTKPDTFDFLGFTHIAGVKRDWHSRNMLNIWRTFLSPSQKLHILRAGSWSIRVTCLEEPDAVTPHVRICEGEIQQ